MGYIVRSGKIEKVLVARLKKNSDLLLSIKGIVEENNIKAGVILSGMGALKRAILRNVKTFPEKSPITDANRSFTTFEGQPLEMVSITGNVSQVEGKTLVHAHMIISKVENEGISVAGGHLVEGCVVYSFTELILAVISDIDMEKFFDEVTQTHQLFRE